jgi:hypothetical protein
MLVSVEFADAGTKSGTHHVLIIGRGSEGLEAGDIGLSLEEAKTLISAIESESVSAQSAEIVEARRQCSCGGKLAIKDWELRRIHTTFGRVYLPSPRVMSCICNPAQRRAISPLKGWSTRSTNELRYLAAKLASQHSYRQAAAILHDLLGVHPRFCHVSVRAATLLAGSRLDRDQIREPFADWRRIRSVPRIVTLAFDGGYARRTRKGAAPQFRDSYWGWRNRRENMCLCKRTQGGYWSQASIGRFRQPPSYYLGTADCPDDRWRRIAAEA